MHAFQILTALSACIHICAAQSNLGIEALVKRRLPHHTSQFSFSLTGSPSTLTSSNITHPPIDEYTVSNGKDGTIHVSGNSPVALASGLRWYLTTYVNVDIYWFIGTNYECAPQTLPKVNSTYSGSSIVPWRYHFNTVTFSYTAAFWTWEEWELQLDWMALRGINLPLAWVGYEKILVEVLLDAGFTEDSISTFLSGPAFQAWNRFGNIQGSWGGNLPMAWIDGQFALQKKIVARMVALGMTPVLPCFTGFVPLAIKTLYPNASFVRGDQWNKFPPNYTNVTFLEPFDPLFEKLQKSFISKQTEAYGTVTHIYTLDQYNENDPFSGDLQYLKNVTKNTISALKAADDQAVWMLQGWLFYSSADFWTNPRIESYLGGVENSDMLILDLFSESAPQWQRTSSYYGKPWIWCELHDYGGNMGLYGQVQNVTHKPVEALNNGTSTMVGMGLTMEGQEGNEIMYDILLDQAWSKTPLDAEGYFHDWVTCRYSPINLPAGVYKAWDTLSKTVYNNTQTDIAESVTKSIFELKPNATGLTTVKGTHSTAILYDPAVLVGVWKGLYGAASTEPSLWDNEAYTFDLTEITRQVLANAFEPLYNKFVSAANHTLNSYSPSTARQTGGEMTSLLSDLDSVLVASGQAHFSLSAWIESARAWANTTDIADYYEYNARNQITLWGPTGEIDSYASKQWGGLIASFYVPRWQMFVEYTLNSTTKSDGENAALSKSLLAFEEAWQTRTSGGEPVSPPSDGQLRKALEEVVRRWPGVFST